MTSRNHALDGLRGIAALAVALGHCNLAITGTDVWAKTVRDFPTMSATEIGGRLLYLMFPSDAAVTLFFVLSGYVLWESFVRSQTRLKDVPDYLLGRAYRLLPVAIVSALPLGFLSDASASELAANMLLLSRSINGVLWSLQVEAICSLAIVVAWLLTRGAPIRLVILLGAIVMAAPAFRGSNFFLFFPAFLLGASIGAMPQRLWEHRSTFFMGLALLVLTSLFLSHSAISRAFEVLGAVAVVAGTRTKPIALLTSRPVLFLGAISYPFYLSHTTGVLLAARLGWTTTTDAPFIQVSILALISVPVAILLAWVIHVGVELPAMRARPRVVSGLRDGLAPVSRE